MKKYLPVEEVIRLYNEGKSTVEISEEYHASICTIGRLLKKKGIKIRNNSEAKLYGKKLPEEEVVRLYNEGKSTVEIGKTYHVSDATIGNLLRKKEIKIRNNSEAHLYGKMLPTVEEAKKLYDEGKSAIKIGKMYNVSNVAIRRLLKKAGIELRNGREARWYGKKLPSAEEIKRLHDEGKRMYEISNIYDIGKTTINRLLKKAKIRFRNAKKDNLEQALRAFGEQE